MFIFKSRRHPRAVLVIVLDVFRIDKGRVFLYLMRLTDPKQ